MKRNGLTVMARLIGLVKPMTGYMILAIAMGLLGHLCASFITILGGYSILNMMGLSQSLSLAVIFVTVVILAALRAILRYGEQTCNHFIAFNLLAILRDKVFRALRRLAPAKLEGRDKGDLISVITSDIELLEVFYAHTISPIGIWMLFTACMCVFIGSIHPVLGILALLSYLVIGAGIPFLISSQSGEAGIHFRNKAGNLSAFVLDSLRGLGEIQQYHAGQARLEEIRHRSNALSADEEQLKKMSGRNTAVTNTVILLFDLGMLLSAAMLYKAGAIGVDGVLLSTLALFASFGPSVALATLGSTLQNTFAAGNRVLDILEENPMVEDVSGKSEIEFHGAAAEQVRFRYGEELILDGLSLDISEKEIVGIVGRSGSGKSTLLKLFMRFWQSQHGKILISGRDVNDINTENLRNMESYVTQETVLFHDSIRNNLKIAKLNATEAEIISACKKASVHDFILALPNGYDTPVGELGDTLSGGERQRIGLARAFLHDAPFMLLDEPTSNLDSLNEAVILRALKEEKENRTILLVSHRESTMRIANRVYSVENGRMS